MKIVLTGGGTWGHFYPLMAVGEKISLVAYENKMLTPKIYFFGSDSYDANLLYERGIFYEEVPSGKRGLLELHKNIFGFFVALYKLFRIYPDVVFSKGARDSLPVCTAAFILRIPIVLHESDSVPGGVNSFISKFANIVTLSYKEAEKYFKNKNIIVSGQPILGKYLPEENFTRAYKKNEIKNLIILGGSQGATRINEAIVAILPELTNKFNVIHQAGKDNVEDIKQRASVILSDKQKENYKVFGTIDLSKYYKISDIAVSRSGSNLFELAAWQIPTVTIPLPESHNDHQKENALICEKAGWVKLLLHENLTPHILLNSLEKIADDQGVYEHMMVSAKDFTNKNAAKFIAERIVDITLGHK